MFPLHQGNELLFRVPYTPSKQHTIQQDMILDCASLDASNLSNHKGHSSAGNLSTRENSDEIANDGKKKRKKIIHRDMERQRRQDMATLYSSLRSLLPLEYVKGKRAISDHMNEAVNYIKHLQKKIKDLGEKRNELKSLANSSSSSNSSGSCVTVCPCLEGLEIRVNGGESHEVMPLSRILETLLEEGLSVLSCISAKVNGRLLHTIQCEVTDITSLDLHGLQQQLSASQVLPRGKLPNDTALRNTPTI